MPEKLLVGKENCDNTLPLGTGRLCTGENEFSVRFETVSKMQGLLAMAFVVLVTIFSIPNASACRYEIQQQNEDQPPRVSVKDEQPKEVNSLDNAIESDEQNPQITVADSGRTAVETEKKLSTVTTIRTIVSEFLKSLLLQAKAIPPICWVLIVPLAGFVIYELCYASYSMMFRPLVCLAIGVALWCSFEMLLVKTFGLLVSTVAFLTITHHLHAKRFRRKTFILGLALGLLAFFSSMMGVLIRIEGGPVREGEVESLSVAAYEATQALMMNMAPHDPRDDAESAAPQPGATGDTSVDIGSDTNKSTVTSADKSTNESPSGVAPQRPVTEPNTTVAVEKTAERIWLTKARICATLLAFFVAYQLLTHYARNAIYQARMTWLGWRTLIGRPDACLVCGVGYVGLRLIRELRQKGRNVIAFEKDEENTNLKAAIDTGAIVLTCDATLIESLDDLPLTAIKTVYVVCGDDTVNLEVAMNVKRKFNPNRNLTEKNVWSIAAWIRIFKQWIERVRTPNNRECFVQIFDTEMQKVLHQTFHNNVGHKGDLQFRPFNADLNAVRNLITDELTLLRPKAADEVALYVVVGFDDRWKEVVHGLTQLAHFENRKRSRILVLTEDPESDSKSFVTRYPRCTVDNPIRPELADVGFCPLTDEWPSTFAGSAKGRTEAEYFRIKDNVAEFEELDLQAMGPHPLKFVRCLVIRHADANKHLDCEVKFKNKVRVRKASQSVIDDMVKQGVISCDKKSKDWVEIEGLEYDIWDFFAACGYGQGEVFKARVWGVEFATQTLFSTLPKVPGDDEFLTQLHRLIDEPNWQKFTGVKIEENARVIPSTRKIRPVMIVAGGDDAKNFTWGNSFAFHWERFRGRHSIQPPAVVGHGHDQPLLDISDIPVFVWISDQEPLRELMDQIGEEAPLAPSSPLAGGAIPGGDQGSKVDLLKVSGVIENGCRSFGEPRKSAGSIAIHESFRRYLSQGVSDAYNHVTSMLVKPKETTGADVKKPDEVPIPALKADPEQYDNQQSNNHAADHAIIKLAMLHEASEWEYRWKELTVRNRELERTGELKEVMGIDALKKDAVLEIPMPDGTAKQVTRDDAQLKVIAEVEHHRWSAELLLRNANWHATELAKRPVEGGGKARVPEDIHIRKTLCPWDQLAKPDLEQQKDIEQVWFILHAFDKPKK